MARNQQPATLNQQSRRAKVLWQQLPSCVTRISGPNASTVQPASTTVVRLKGKVNLQQLRVKAARDLHTLEREEEGNAITTGT